MDTFRAKLARSQNLSEKQREIVVGSLLGDGYLVETTRGFAFRVNHGLAQRDYVDWKFMELENFTNSEPRQSGSCYYFRTVSHSYFDRLREDFYNGRRKMLPKNLPEWITPLVLAVWIMDDGSKDGLQLSINSQSFSEAENYDLVSI